MSLCSDTFRVVVFVVRIRVLARFVVIGTFLDYLLVILRGT